MNYQDQKIQDALSSEYVIGTLKGQARVRYQRLLMQDNPLRKTLWWWENQLNELGSTLPVENPDTRVWNNIQQRLGFVNKQEIVAAIPWWRAWQSLGFTMLIGLVLMFGFLLMSQNQQILIDPTQKVAIVQNTKAEALWLIEIKQKSLRIQTTVKLPQYTDKDYQLWMIAKDGRAPISLGLLPKSGESILAKSTLFDQLEIAALAVSLEPLGGSPNGQPTEVLYTTELVVL